MVRSHTAPGHGVIRGYHADIDPAARGFTATVMVQVTLKGPSKPDLSEFEFAVQQCDSVLCCSLMAGSDDCLLILPMRDLVDFEHVRRTQPSRLPHVARNQSSFALRDAVRRALPAGLLRD